MTAARDIQVGERHGRLVVTSNSFVRDPSGKAWFLCHCDCGVERKFPFKGGFEARSCGCLQREVAAAGKQTHGGSKTRLNGIWRGIKQRCQNPLDTSYHRYGGRGITVCETWQSYEPFRDWALANGYSADLTLDRTDNDGPYSPENCHWVTVAENNRNRRNTHRVDAWGETKPVCTWAEDSRCTVSARTLSTRLRLGWNPEDAMTLPLYTRPFGRQPNGKRRPRSVVTD